MNDINNKCECNFCNNILVKELFNTFIVKENSPISCSNFLKKIEISKDKIVSNLIDYKTNNPLFSYYIGAFWINKNQSLIIKPKIENIDFFKMFNKCLEYSNIIKDFHSIYNINFDEKTIKHKDSSLINSLDILIVIHFIKLLELELHNGLKRNFIKKEENLNSKIKGKILFSNNIRKNLVNNRNDRIYCSYLDYDINCLENRILKKALKICISKNIKNNYSYCVSFFNEVSDELHLYELNKVKLNPLYKKYKILIELAIKIIKMKRYKDTHNINEAPPFYINMSLLFEKYVYSLLKEKLKNTENTILYQKSYLNGRFIPDFIIKGKDYNYIADTKYKEIYINHYDKNDIMQLSAYSRIAKITDEFKEDKEYQENNYIPKCLIIYVNNDDDNNIDFNNIEEIKHFVNFYKLKVSLPVFE